ncbi:sensor histidine kinase [Mangrovimonas xylaniphaga]|uniref:sensor histidine kinase n=1 Tax=Mangrovimonas xylaniphaga TaxID=1645915 RepID=UPI0006B5685C|nr:histidine kinase [Mangrovimonas xylaniphaga]
MNDFFKKYKNRKAISIISHILVWGFIFSTPYLLSNSSGQNQFDRAIMVRTWLQLSVFASIFYLNYIWLIDRLLFKKKVWLFSMINLICIIALISLQFQLNHLVFDGMREMPPMKMENMKNPPPKDLFFYLQFITYLLPLAFAIAIKTTERWMKIEFEKTEADNVKLHSELQHLQYQLQPHFFFNSLNNIYALVDTAPETAKTSLHGLAKLMRYLLYDTKTESVSLSHEIDFIKRYIELGKIRIPETTQVNYTFPVVSQNIKIAPLLFISLIENAFKHGVSANKEGDISFNMDINNNKVLFVSKNPNFPKEKSDKSGSGIGLENLKKRLELLYPGKHSLTTELKDNTYTTVLEIDLNH